MAVPKMIGSDRELSTSGTLRKKSGEESISPWEVTQAVLEHTGAAFEALGQRPWTRESRYGGWGYESAFSSDCLRRWLPSGQVAYADMSHVEICTAETLRPRTYAAQSISTLLIAEAARKRAEAEAEPGTQFSLTASNVDMLDPSISWGTHDNLTVSTALWEDLFLEQSHPARLGFVASALAAAIPFFGAGYILPLKERPVFSLSARAHHISKLKTLATTEAFRRGLLNTRREPHGEGQERLHLIGFDFTLVSAALKASFLQCCLAAAEEGFCGLILYDPLRALRTWSWNIDLGSGKLPAVAQLVDGKAVTLPLYVRTLARRLLQMCESGLITDEVAPEAREHLPRIIELTRYAEEGALEPLARHCDWAAKLLCLVDLCAEPGATFGDASTRLADHDFAATRKQAMFWRLWEKGLVDPLVAMSDVEDCLVDGPPESRAWGRGRLIQKFYPKITSVDWSYVELRRGDDLWGRRLRVEMPRLDSLSRPNFEAILEEADGDVAILERLLEEEERTEAGEGDPVMDIRSQLILDPEEDTACDILTPGEESRDWVN